MVVVMTCHVFSGLGIFCADEFLLPFRAQGIVVSALTVAETYRDSADYSISVSMNADSQGSAAPCDCKKKKKCPAIPRSLMTSNSTNRLSEFQREAESECFDSLASQVTDNYFATRGNSPFLEFSRRQASFCLDSLSLTCILLI